MEQETQEKDLELFIECINRWAEQTDQRLTELEKQDRIDPSVVTRLLEKVNELNARIRKLEKWKSDWLF